MRLMIAGMAAMAALGTAAAERATLSRDAIVCFDAVNAEGFTKDRVTPVDESLLAHGACTIVPAGTPVKTFEDRPVLALGGVTLHPVDWTLAMARDGIDIRDARAEDADAAIAPYRDVTRGLDKRMAAFEHCETKRVALDARIRAYNEERVASERSRRGNAGIVSVMATNSPLSDEGDRLRTVRAALMRECDDVERPVVDRRYPALRKALEKQ